MDFHWFSDVFARFSAEYPAISVLIRLFSPDFSDQWRLAAGLGEFFRTVNRFPGKSQRKPEMTGATSL